MDKIGNPLYQKITISRKNRVIDIKTEIRILKSIILHICNCILYAY